MSDTYGLPEMVAELMRDEGTLLYVYDDATGLPIVAGMLVKGNPTIGTWLRTSCFSGMILSEPR
jgi:hypothetical protein